MEMACNNLCNSCTNIGCIVKNESAFYIPPYVEPDNCGNYVVMQPTIEAISKDQYEARLKADMIAMLEDLKKEIEELKNEPHCCQHFTRGIRRSSEVIQQKIDALKTEKEVGDVNYD